MPLILLQEKWDQEVEEVKSSVRIRLYSTTKNLEEERQVERSRSGLPLRQKRRADRELLLSLTPPTNQMWLSRNRSNFLAHSIPSCE